MRLLSFSFFAFLAISGFSGTGRAQEVYQCGVPEHPGIGKTDDQKFWKYCDIYGRRYSYIEEQKSFREELDERRANYAAYRQEALESYEDELELYYLLIE